MWNDYNEYDESSVSSSSFFLRGAAAAAVAARSLNEEEDPGELERLANSFRDGVTLRNAVAIYGGVLVLVTCLYSWLRRRHPQTYNIRSWIPKLESHLATEEAERMPLECWFTWMWRAYTITDDEIMQECGMDACCFVRLIHMGYRLSWMGIFNMLWLLPTYKTAKESAETAGITDPLVQTTIAFVSSGSNRLFAMVFAAYIMFGYTMYLILQEFEWYIEMRHKFLARTEPEHFAVFVRNIPPYLRNNESLADFFRSCFSAEAVLEARLAITVPSLAKLQQQRKSTLESLEHALAIQQTTGRRPLQKEALYGLAGVAVDSIDLYTSRLADLNARIAQKIAYYETVVRGGPIPHSPYTSAQAWNQLETPTTVASSAHVPSISFQIPEEDEDESDFDDDNEVGQKLLSKPLPKRPGLFPAFSTVLDPQEVSTASSSVDGQFYDPTPSPNGTLSPRTPNHPPVLSPQHSSSFEDAEQGPTDQQPQPQPPNRDSSNNNNNNNDSNASSKNILRRSVHMTKRSVQVSRKIGESVVKASKNTVTTAAKVSGGAVATAAKVSAGTVANAAKVSASTVLASANTVTNLTQQAGQNVMNIISGEDGEIKSAGFVVFHKLSTTNAALQMTHHSEPFSIEVMEAPDPKEVNWANVGRTHKDLQIGFLGSLVCTTGLCLLWTLPMSFFASLANVSSVRQQVTVLDNLFNKYPGLVPVIEQLAPLLVVMFNGLLPIILEHISQLEGPISMGMLEASTFIKLAAFSIIQTFFVSAVSGGVIQAISEIINDWTKFMDLLANSLPSQGTYFMQILLVSTATSAGMELLRVIPLAFAFARRFIGPNLTEKERSKKLMFLRPISDPREFEHAEFAAQLVLYFMVLFVYAVISPITPLITAFCFAYLGAMFRTQFMYCYPKTPDSGGKLWANFIQILLTCMIIAQITLLGLLALKKGVVQFPLFLPLMYITILFNLYIKQKHFNIAAYLPTRECVKADLKRPEPCDYSFVLGAYTQPELKAKEYLRPDPELLEEPGMTAWEKDEDEDETKGSSCMSRARLSRGRSTRRVVLIPDDDEEPDPWE